MDLERREGTYHGMLRCWWRAILSIAVMTGMYFVVPLRQADLEGTQIIGRSALLLAGLTGLTYLVVKQARRALDTGWLTTEQISALLTVTDMVILFFSIAYYLMSVQFTGLRTRLDALYFAVTTLATVGFGDVAATGQAARSVVIAQMLFDLIVVTSAVSIIVTAPRRPNDRHRSSPSQSSMNT